MKIVFYPTKYRALIDRIADSFPEATVVRADTPQMLPDSLDGAEVFVIANSAYTPEVARIVREHGQRLRWVQFTTSGIDIALESGLIEGVTVTNGSGMHARRVAEHAFALLLAVVRQLNEAAAARPRRAWIRQELSTRLTSIERKALAVIGLGAIGQDIARKAKAFDMRVIGVSRSPGPYAYVDDVRPRDRLREILAEADAVILATAHEAETHKMIDAAAIAAMKPTAVLVNIARGLLVDETALIAALKEGRIAGAGLDVTAEEPLPAASELWDLPNVVLTPHSAGVGGDNTEALFEIIGGNLKRFLAGKPLDNVVRGPSLPN